MAETRPEPSGSGKIIRIPSIERTPNPNYLNPTKAAFDAMSPRAIALCTIPVEIDDDAEGVFAVSEATFYRTDLHTPGEIELYLRRFRNGSSLHKFGGLAIGIRFTEARDTFARNVVDMTPNFSITPLTNGIQTGNAEGIVSMGNVLEAYDGQPTDYSFLTECR